MKASILLINPPIHDFAAFDMWARPAGLLYLAGALGKAGYETQLLDATWWKGAPHRRSREAVAPIRSAHGSGHFHKQKLPFPEELSGRGILRHYSCYGLTAHDIAVALDDLRTPDLVMVTSIMTYWYPGVRDTIACVRERFPGVPVVLGGVYATLMPEHAMRVCEPDHILPGQRVFSIVEDVGRILDSPTSAPVQTRIIAPGAHRSVSPPSYDLVSGADNAAVFTSLGCSGGCSYCAAGLLVPEPVKRGIDETVEEISFLHRKRGITDFAFLDDALVIHRDRFELLCQRLAAARLKVRFHCPNGLHAASVDRVMAQQMFDAGFRTIKVGDRRTHTPEHRLDTRALSSAVEALLSAPFDRSAIGLYFLVGFPGHTPERALAEAAELRGLPVKTHLNLFSPVPGTPDFAGALEDSCEDLEAEPLWHNTTLFPYWSRTFSLETVNKLKRLLNPR